MSELTAQQGPKGEMVLRTIAMPADTNPNGDIFGGWLLSQMDLAGLLAAEMRIDKHVTTVAIDSMVFKHPVKVGDAVCCYAEITRIGNTSIQVSIEAWIRSRRKKDTVVPVTAGVFTYVAIDDNGCKIPIGDV